MRFPRFNPARVSLLHTLALCSGAIFLAPPLSGDEQLAAPETEPSRGTIQGRIRYAADPERPWKNGADFIKDPKSGALADAVVTLQPRETPANQRSAQTHVMDQENFLFVPRTLAIRSGDRVKFTNSDDAIHNVFTNDTRDAINVHMVKGGEYVHTFTELAKENNVIRLGCVYHSDMHAWIVIHDGSHAQVTAPDGVYRFENVAPGAYTFTVQHPGGGLRIATTVEIREGDSVDADLTLTPDHRSPSEAATIKAEVPGD